MPDVDEQLHILTEFNADIGQEVAPYQRTDKRKHAKNRKARLENPRRKRDESPYDGQHSANEKSDIAVFIHPIIGDFHILLAQQQPATMFFEERPASVKSQQIRNHRSNQTPEGARQRRQMQVHLALLNQ